MPDVFAHGMLGMAWLGRLLTSWVPQSRLRRFDARFQGITHLGNAMRCSGRVVEKLEHDGERCVRIELQQRQPVRTDQDRRRGPRRPALNHSSPGEHPHDTQTRRQGRPHHRLGPRHRPRDRAQARQRRRARRRQRPRRRARRRRPWQAIREAGGQAVACVGSVTAPDFAERFVGTAVSEFKGLDIIVNNAGYTWDNVIQKMTDEQWYAMLDCHLTAPFRILRAAQPVIRELAKAEKEAGQRVGAQGRQHLVDGRPVRQRRPDQLLGRQGRHRRHDADAGQGVGPHERHRQLRGLRPHQDPPDRSAPPATPRPTSTAARSRSASTPT